MKIKRKLLVTVGIALTAALGLFALAGCGSSGGASGDAADTVITGTIYTLDGEDATCEAVAVKDGEIVYVGDKDGADAYVGDSTEVIETGDGIALPAFAEAHAHGVEGGFESLYEVLLYEGESYEDYLATMEDFMKDVDKDVKFIRGSGWINGYVPKGGPRAEDLDKITGDIPTILTSGDHHSYWVNTACMKEAGIIDKKGEVKGIETDDSGNPTGLLREDAMDLVDQAIPDYTVDQYKDAIMFYENEAVGYGITSMFEPMINLNGSENILKAYNELDEEGALLMNVYGGYQIMPGDDIDKTIADAVAKKEEAAGGMFEITAIKLLTDGVVEGHTAYLLEDYADTPGDPGKPEFTDDYLKELYLKAQEAGLQIHAHCIGDAAVRQTLDALEYVADETGTTDCRHAITHLQVVDKADAQRMADLNVIAVTNPYWFLKEPGYYNEIEVPYLGEERASKEYPMKDFFDAGCVVTSASDYPVTLPPAPLGAIQQGATRVAADDPSTLLGEDQIVSVEDMVKTVTTNIAYQNFQEENTGSLEVGKNADIVVLDQNIYEIDPLKIADTKVLKTIWRGQTTYSDGEDK